jgi:hypothetical protein
MVPYHFQPVRLAYQPPVNSTFLSEQTSHQQPVSSTFLSEQTSHRNQSAVLFSQNKSAPATSHQPNEQTVLCHVVLVPTRIKKDCMSIFF